MKKTTLIFLSTLIAVLLSASTSYAYYSTNSACKASCTYSCRSFSSPCSSSVYVCVIKASQGATVGSYGGATVRESFLFETNSGCQARRQRDVENGYSARSSCYASDGGYRYDESMSRNIADCNGEWPDPPEPACPAGCSTCSSSTTCTTCDGGFYLSSGSCLACPANAMCNGSSTYSCKSGYLRQGDACVTCPANATCDGSSNFSCKSGYLRQEDTCVTCPANATCDGSSNFSCKSDYWLQSGTCKSCPANATCNGSTFMCHSGYKKSGNSCIKDRTVNSCPSRMKLSSDGCCCVNK